MLRSNGSGTGSDGECWEVTEAVEGLSRSVGE